jgi:ATP-dependent Zn protease
VKGRPVNNLRNLALWILIALLLVFLFNMFQNTGQHQNPSVISYTQFNQEAVQGQVSKVTIQDRTIKGELTNGQAFTTYTPDDPSLVPMLKEHNVNITAAPPDDGINLMSVFINWFPMLLLIGVWVFFLRQMQAGGGKAMGFGKSRAKLLTERTGRVTFEDVAGVDEAKDELKEIVDFLRDPQKFQRLGGRIPKGVLLVGPRGPARPCSRAPLRAKRMFRSSRSPDPISSRCSWVSARAACATCSSRRKRMLPVLCSSMKSTPSDVIAAQVSVAAMTSANRHSISCSWRWTASKPMKA